MGQLITIEFRSDTLFAVERDDGVFVAIKPISDRLGLVWRKQQERLKRDQILAEGITMTVMPSVGGAQETTLLRLDLVNGWLFGIDESRVADEETRQRVLTYKRECYRVLFEHFHGKALGPAANRGVVDEDGGPGTEGTRVRLVTEARHVFGEGSARQLWFKLGLPIVPAMTAPRAEQLNLLPPEPPPEEQKAA